MSNLAGQSLGRYQILEQLGKGGFGIVYKALDTVLGREAALKILHPQLTVDADFIERFRNEARTIAAFDHPNIATVYDLGEESGRVYIAMRYLPGGSLRDRLKQKGPLPFDQAMQIIKEVSGGLQVAHAKGLVHRDIKPENILFTRDGQAVISDFGLAKAIQVSSSSTSSSIGGIGTPAYRAPELWRGKPPASPATDEYSLACVLTEILTGKQLFEGDTPDEIITKHLVDGPALPKKWPDGVPEWINDVLSNALEKNPEDRYPDLRAFVAALDGLVVGRVPVLQEGRGGVTPQRGQIAPRREQTPAQSVERLSDHERTSSAMGRYLVWGVPLASVVVIALFAGYVLLKGLLPTSQPTLMPGGATAVDSTNGPDPATATVAAALTHLALTQFAPPATEAPTQAPPATVAPTMTLPPPVIRFYTASTYADCWDHPGATDISQYGHYALAVGQRAPALGESDVAGYPLPWILVDVSPAPVWDTRDDCCWVDLNNGTLNVPLDQIKPIIGWQDYMRANCSAFKASP